jgi:hypothetical protein
MDVIVIRDDVRVSGSMMAYRLVLFQIFTHWLPGAGPIIPVLQVSYINVGSLRKDKNNVITKDREDSSGLFGLPQEVPEGDGG